MILGERIKKIRTDMGLSQVEFANKLNLSKQAISNYEANIREPGLDIVLMISEKCNISTDYLLGRSDYKTLEAQKLSNSNLNTLDLKTINKLGSFSDEDLRLINRLLLSGAFDKLIAALSRYNNLTKEDILQYCYLKYGEHSPLAQLKAPDPSCRDVFKKELLKGYFDEAMNGLLEMLDKFYKIDNLEEDDE